ncbi:hypothetical protein D038_1198 [Vibrio parahaemolyticus IDH02189]|nr:hypothetical protein D038_1198 [Vibrio parahaemolyticus IDH02189]
MSVFVLIPAIPLRLVMTCVQKKIANALLLNLTVLWVCTICEQCI